MGVVIPLLWIAANKHKEIVCVKFMEMLKQHHLQAWQIKAKRDNLSQEAVTGILKVPTHFRDIGRDNTQIISARGGYQVTGYRHHKTLIKTRKSSIAL